MSEYSGVHLIWEENELLSSSDLGVHVARMGCPGLVHPQFLQGTDGKSLQVGGQHFEEAGASHLVSLYFAGLKAAPLPSVLASRLSTSR